MGAESAETAAPETPTRSGPFFRIAATFHDHCPAGTPQMFSNVVALTRGGLGVWRAMERQTQDSDRHPQGSALIEAEPFLVTLPEVQPQELPPRPKTDPTTSLGQAEAAPAETMHALMGGEQGAGI